MTEARGRSDTEAPLHSLRRRDREKDQAWIRGFLREAPFGFLATVQAGRPFLNSNLFVYDQGADALYLHTARTGRTPANVAQGGLATFSTAMMGRFLPAAEALEFSVEYASVVVFGTISLVRGIDDRRLALELIMEKYASHLEAGRDYRPITVSELRRTAVHRLDIEAWSGKERLAGPEFPGAYTVSFPALPFHPSSGSDSSDT